jgi:uroporphyrinogen decarboxylase
LGHGITPEVPPENVAVLIDAVHEKSKAYHKEYTNNKVTSNT